MVGNHLGCVEIVKITSHGMSELVGPEVCFESTVKVEEECGSIVKEEVIVSVSDEKSQPSFLPEMKSKVAIKTEPEDVKSEITSFDPFVHCIVKEELTSMSGDMELLSGMESELSIKREPKD